MSKDADDLRASALESTTMLAMMGNPAPMSAPGRGKPDKPTTRRRRSVSTPLNGSILFPIPDQPKPKQRTKGTTVPVASDIYDVVLDLRRAGMSVYRQGAHHQLDGRTLNDVELRLVWKELRRAAAAG